MPPVPNVEARAWNHRSASGATRSLSSAWLIRFRMSSSAYNGSGLSPRVRSVRSRLMTILATIAVSNHYEAIVPRCPKRRAGQNPRLRAGSAGTFRGVPMLEQAVYDYVDGHNDDPQPFVWTADLADILPQTARAHETLDTVRNQ
jgi:hypothetical protein